MGDKLFNDIYGNLFEKIKETTKPEEIIKILTDFGKTLKQGDTFISGTRTFDEKGNKLAALTTTLNYIPLPTEKEQAFGFLNGTGKKYELNSGNQIEKDLAKALLEIASPIPKEDSELLKSPLAIKLLGVGVYWLIAGKENYNKMVEIVNDPSKISENKAAIDEFRTFVENVRESQLEGKPYIANTKYGEIIIDMSNTEINSGAYSKCGNASVAVNEKGTVKIKQKKGALGVIDVTNEYINSKLTKKFLSLGLSVGLTSESTPGKPPEEKKPPEETKGREIKHAPKQTKGANPDERIDRTKISKDIGA
jgi:hypothetical protein